jgi:hypothetical protein
MKELVDKLTDFKDVAKADLRKGFPVLRTLYPGERFYVLGLSRSALFGYITPVGNTEEVLADEEARWNPGDWECRLPGLDGMQTSIQALEELQLLLLDSDEEQFDGVARALQDCLFALLAELREEGAFDAFGDRSELLLNVVTPDDTYVNWLADAKRLNGRNIWGRMEAHLREFGLL